MINKKEKKMLNWKMGSIYVIGTRGFVGMRALMSKTLVNWGGPLLVTVSQPVFECETTLYEST